MDSNTLVSKLALQLGRSAADIEARISALSALLVESIAEGDSILIPGFGIFEPKMKMERVATHPATGKKLLVPPKLTIAFRPASSLKQKVR